MPSRAVSDALVFAVIFFFFLDWKITISFSTGDGNESKAVAKTSAFAVNQEEMSLVVSITETPKSVEFEELIVAKLAEVHVQDKGCDTDEDDDSDTSKWSKVAEEESSQFDTLVLVKSVAETDKKVEDAGENAIKMLTIVDGYCNEYMGK